MCGVALASHLRICIYVASALATLSFPRHSVLRLLLHKVLTELEDGWVGKVFKELSLIPRTQCQP